MAAQPNVPYQAYRSKRHSRTVSSVPLIPDVTPPSLSRPSSIVSNGSVGVAPAAFTQSAEDFETEKVSTEYSAVVPAVTNKTAVIHIVPSTKELPSPPSSNVSPIAAETSQDSSSSTGSHSPIVESSPADNLNQQTRPRTMENEGRSTSPVASPSQALPPLPAVQSSPGNPKKTSTFRRIAPRSAVTRSSLPLSPLGPPRQSRVSSTQSSASDQLNIPQSPPLHSRVTSISSVMSEPSTVNQNFASTSNPRRLLAAPQPIVPATPSLIQSPSRLPSQLPPPQPSLKAAGSTSLSTQPVASQASSTQASNPPLPKATNRLLAPYRPGFQPRGVYRPRTDEFSLARKTKADSGRIERTKLERRLEKLIHLHFPVNGEESAGPKRIVEQRRASSLFDLDISSIKNMDAAEIWKGVIKSQAFQGAKNDIRAAEQRITPWQEDSAVSNCPFCHASFHPLTNRKHHCRLCGQIICSLPIKRPQRPEPCSILFVVDSKTREIEEVGEGVDYGVRKRRSIDPSRKGKQEDVLSEDEKFLKGVRICRNCKPILARERYRQDVMRIPIFVRLYEAFVSLEKEIEEWLPQFQELLSTLSNDHQPTKEASAARKRLLDAFAEYDALSKRIRNLPCPPGGSQDRVQLAILTRANIFLQKNMFPLQFMPKPKNGVSNIQPSEGPPVVDPDSELAYALQPLLEQEALLESFVGEAMAHRKFEDAKTLKANLAEIRLEIDRMLSGGTA
ncbi:FYVE zinc finger-domain-containing protein [Pisolithus croceorrhizus]|nr:FYVE zinc finger-domain-containing protein [Pisolithus croceorrhizus]